MLAPLDEEDFKQHSWIPHSGWKISRDTLDPYYAEVSNFFGFSSDVFYNPADYCDFEYENKKISLILLCSSKKCLFTRRNILEQMLLLRRF